MIRRELAHCAAWRLRNGAKSAACLFLRDAGRHGARCPMCALLELELERQEREARAGLRAVR